MAVNDNSQASQGATLGKNPVSFAMEAMSTNEISQRPVVMAEEPKLAVGESAYPLLPLQYAGGDFGLNLDSPHPPHIQIQDGAGVLWWAPDAEWVLRNIEHFTDRERDRMLFCAARQYGFEDMYILIRGRA